MGRTLSQRQVAEERWFEREVGGLSERQPSVLPRLHNVGADARLAERPHGLQPVQPLDKDEGRAVGQDLDRRGEALIENVLGDLRDAGWIQRLRALHRDPDVPDIDRLCFQHLVIRSFERHARPRQPVPKFGQTSIE